jgi:hypothetical protein
MRTKSFLFLTFILTLAFASCNKATPAGFWKSYKKDFLEKNISDQGPHGGHRAIYWKSGRTNTFTSTDVIEFAKKNDWTLVDSLTFNAEQTTKWMYNNKAVFPLTSTGFSDTIENNTQLEHFPRWFGGQITVFKFRTGWVTIEPGTDNSIEENGFVVLNSDRTQMAVYHLWGE